MSLFVCAKCGCVDNTATSSYWMLTNEYMVDKFEYAKEPQPYKGMGLCSECGSQAHWRIIPIYPYTTFIATTMIKITSIGNQIRG